MLWRWYLLVGLIGHKVLWEVLRQPARGASEAPPWSLRLALIKTVKLGILGGIALQTMLPDILPITTESFWLRCIGLTLYTLGLSTAIAARLQLGKNWSDIETAQVLQHQQVVSGGIYGYIRHPIYVGDLLLLLGLELSLNSWLVVLVCLMIPMVLRQAIREEILLHSALPGYARYCAHTKRFIPFVV